MCFSELHVICVYDISLNILSNRILCFKKIIVIKNEIDKSDAITCIPDPKLSVEYSLLCIFIYSCNDLCLESELEN